MCYLSVAVGLYPSVLGASFNELSPVVRAFHVGGRSLRARGVFAVQHSRFWIGRVLVRLAGLPRAGDGVDVRLEVSATARGERWSRIFGGVAMVSEQWQDGGHIVERVGTTEVRFALVNEQGALVFRQVRHALRLGPLRLPLPSFLAVRVSARVHEEHGAMVSDIRMEAPVLGLILRYSGRLEVVT